MNARAISATLWFVVALAPMAASQVFRLQYNDPAGWLFWDYVGRLCTLHALLVIPSLSNVAFRQCKRRIELWEVALWIGSVFVVNRFLYGWLQPAINAALPSTVLGAYPRPTGWLYLFDMVFGLALVAYSEEIVFRRCLVHVLEGWMDGGYRLVFASSVLFGAYHWWTGVGGVVTAAFVGVLLMCFLRRSGALWPVVLCHYLIDLVAFV